MNKFFERPMASAVKSMALLLKKEFAFCLGFILFALVACQAQQPSIRQWQDRAKSLVQQGEYENAILILERGLDQAPNNIALLKDLSYAAYLNRDYSKAMEVGKRAIMQANADPQAYQILGLTYKALAMYKEAANLYLNGLKKFPKSGVLFNEYAELLAIDQQLEKAILQWEKGIQADPGFNSNYYNATMYYMQSNEWLKVLLYGEIFVNLESFTDRTDEVKLQLYQASKNLLNKNTLIYFISRKGKSAFEQLVLSTYLKVLGASIGSLSIDSLNAVRKRFVDEWMQTAEQNFSFRLFNHQQYLMQQGLFDAYNQWLFATSSNPAAYQEWLSSHRKEKEAFQTFQQSRVFKLPLGQYYF